MKTKTPIWTYIITFLNPIIPSCIMIVLGLSFVMVTTSDTEPKTVLSKVTFMDVYFVSVLLGLYLCGAVSLLYYYVIREGILRPRWWTNLLLILFAYGIIPLAAFVLGPQEAACDAQSAIGEQFGRVVVIAIIGFMVITVATRPRAEPDIG